MLARRVRPGLELLAESADKLDDLRDLSLHRPVQPAYALRVAAL